MFLSCLNYDKIMHTHTLDSDVSQEGIGQASKSNASALFGTIFKRHTSKYVVIDLLFIYNKLLVLKICHSLQQGREQVAQAYFEIWTIEVGIGMKNKSLKF